jgi:hypothetical protein
MDMCINRIGGKTFVLWEKDMKGSPAFCASRSPNNSVSVSNGLAPSRLLCWFYNPWGTRLGHRWSPLVTLGTKASPGASDAQQTHTV